MPRAYRWLRLCREEKGGWVAARGAGPVELGVGMRGGHGEELGATGATRYAHLAHRPGPREDRSALHRGVAVVQVARRVLVRLPLQDGVCGPGSFDVSFHSHPRCGQNLSVGGTPAHARQEGAS